ncbi:MAG: isocitrate lyase/PEP mutase family protein [Aestuariivita sp.]|nr:isocitrate lyase/PEP mutase family protein [Aestuariivita sp.]MCY4203068.1 isocitrate lyase/PEP mutase family protein [Aestuariivita sp.]MCY4289336.1 isocitrate lyase/PEP mutase family protein [Aestuariivita sp.]MCY4347781.1 isocitrate lyase/PEP mutase family protein [Aestuariivita sp.]
MNSAQQLRTLLQQDCCHAMPCCFDALSAKLIEQEGFPVTFLSGFAASASRIGAPDLGLMSYGEVIDQTRNTASAISIPLIGDGDTGYGNAMNVRRTVRGFALAGAASVMLEDQLAPKRCGHTKGKEVVARDEAYDRIRAAVDEREQLRSEGMDILILARTDSMQDFGLAEAITRTEKFAEIGADILFVEAVRSVGEMKDICSSLPGPKMVNIVDGGETPNLPNTVLHEIGYSIAAYPLSLLAAAMKAMVGALQSIRTEEHAVQMTFAELRQRIGFCDYYHQASAYATSNRDEE